jgi:hypothetical protein
MRGNGTGELAGADVPGEPRDPRRRDPATMARLDRTMSGRPHVIPWYQAEDRATRDALDVQVCKECGAVLWRRETTKDKPRYPPAALVGDDCPGSEEQSSMAKKTASGRTKRGRPEQADLPGTEDSAIKPLEDAAKAYARVRDERMELTQEEAKRKAALIPLMHKYQKTTYKRHGIEINLIPEGEDVKVKIGKPGGDADEE